MVGRWLVRSVMLAGVVDVGAGGPHLGANPEGGRLGLKVSTRGRHVAWGGNHPVCAVGGGGGLPAAFSAGHAFWGRRHFPAGFPPPHPFWAGADSAAGCFLRDPRQAAARRGRRVAAGGVAAFSPFNRHFDT
ncbi:hypothetical protein BWD09_13545, partial [Neisseria dentiae]